MEGSKVYEGDGGGLEGLGGRRWRARRSMREMVQGSKFYERDGGLKGMCWVSTRNVVNGEHGYCEGRGRVWWRIARVIVGMWGRGRKE